MWCSKLRLRQRFNYGLAVLLITLPLQLAFAQQLNVEIRGVDGKLKENVESLLEIKRLANNDNQDSLSAYRIRYLHRQAAKDIRQALEPFGYYHVQVNSELKTQTTPWLALYNITLNEPVRIGDVSWVIKGEAENDPAFQAWAATHRPQTGEVFNHQRYESAKSKLNQLASEHGYHQAEFTEHQVRVDIASNRANITVVFDSGPRYHFGPVSFSAAELTDAFLQRYVTFAPGDPYYAEKVLDLQMALVDSQYFESVIIKPLWPESGSTEVPIDVDTTPNAKSHYRVGLGYGTDTGARLTFAQDRRWVNDSGHHYQAALRLSQVQSTGSFTYIIPGRSPRTDSYRLRGEVSNKRNEEQHSKKYLVGVSDIRRLGGWQRTYALDLMQENFSIGDFEEGNSQFLVPRTHWNYISARDRLNVNEGYRIELGLKGGSDSVLSDTTFVSATASAKSILPFTDRWRVISRLALGATKVDDFSVLPPSLRFFTGGDNSVRGYGYEQLGPRNADGAVIGGRYLVAGSVEFDYRFAEQWRVAVFTDIGNVMLEPNQPLKQSIGFGFRWISPIGSIRLDFAQAIDEPDKPWRLHFTLGPDL
ncbi:outer membrane protein assembly factor [Idiomarina tyrosinivorans]|uniref:Translocation and assembly module subunit TamA n=1 Tax=Idiomarina tyrosinivorans TaxID=1445662 RepID=A0A432ZLD6_9GAMM|nr:outer membrane protein assembly factor [Idiomarina tyrosinivorans]